MSYQLCRDVYIFQSSVWQTNSSVILNEAANIIIDPCYFPVEIQVIADFVNRRRSFNKYIIFTHSDFDHLAGYQYFKKAKLIGQEGIAACDREVQVRQLEETDQTYFIKRKTPFVFPQLDLTFQTDYRISLKNDELVLIHAPGHTADSSFIISTGKRIMFAGDYLSDLEFPFVYFNTGAYLRSLELAAKLVRDLALEYVVPGHGEAALGTDEILARINTDREYLTNLVEEARNLLGLGLREREIIEVLGSLKYKNEPIAEAIRKMHEENVKLVLQELQTF